jgi:hypothetical protein
MLENTRMDDGRCAICSDILVNAPILPRLTLPQTAANIIWRDSIPAPATGLITPTRKGPS